MRQEDTHHERLSALDQTFLAFETRNAPMHVALTGIFEPGSLATEDGGVDIDRIRRHIAARLRFIPRYRQRVVMLPILNDAVWVDDDAFDLAFHVRHTSLPRPGGKRQLQRRCAEILERPLDRGRPLWEMWFVEGLEGGRFAMVAKVHHCMVDGIAGIDILAALLGTEPSEVEEPIEPWQPRPAPRQRDVLLGELRRRGASSLDAVRRVGDFLSRPGDASRATGAGVAAFVRLLSKLSGASSTPFNQPIGPHRRVDWFSIGIAEVRAIRAALGGTLNDVVLATVSGAIRRFLERHRVDVDSLDFRVMAPVSVRSTDERGTLGNRVSAWMVPLPLGERDPRAALAAIRHTTEHLKESKEAMGAEVLTQVGEWTPSTLLSLASRMMTRALPFNLVVTNVPGPQLPLYLMSARMLDNFGLIPLTDYLCLGIVLFSYDGQLCWGFTCEWDLLPDLHDFVLDVRAAFDDLQAAAAAASARKASVRKPARRVTAKTQRRKA